MKKTRQRSNRAPPGWRTVTPRVFAKDSKRLIAFVKKVFAAEGAYSAERPTVLRIGDSNVMISEAGIRAAMGAFLYVYVADVDAVYRRAVKAGAHSTEAPTSTEYGDRRCMLEDKWGNVWQVATRSRTRRPTQSRVV